LFSQKTTIFLDILKQIAIFVKTNNIVR